jgi:predicted alpha/beta hydrolase
MQPTGAATLHRITTDDDVSLAVHRLGPREGTPVLLVPGTFSNWSFWLGTRGTGFARLIAHAGYEAWVLDFRGHGASQGPARAQRWCFDDWGRRDIPAAVRAIRAEGRQPILVGHSAGALSILAALAADPDVASSARSAIIAAAPLPWMQRWRRPVAHALRFAARRLTAFPARMLRLGPEDEVPGVMEQWLSWHLERRWIGSDGTDYPAALARVRTPLLFLAGAGDHRFAPPAAVRAVHDLATAAPRRWVLAGRESGFTTDYDHAALIVSRPARAEVWPLLLDWLHEHDRRPVTPPAAASSEPSSEPPLRRPRS